MPRLIIAVLVVAALVAGSQWVPGNGPETIERYCQFGAVSQAQLDGCIENVTVDQIKTRDTLAADYALERLKVCLPESGPFCEGPDRQGETKPSPATKRDASDFNWEEAAEGPGNFDWESAKDGDFDWPDD